MSASSLDRQWELRSGLQWAMLWAELLVRQSEQLSDLL
jgi:hypothetical protein